MDGFDVRLVRLPFLIPLWAVAQVLLPGRVFVRRGARLDRRLLAHELVHVEQLESLGLLRYWYTYLRLLARCGYREHPMEYDAIVRSAEPRFLRWADSLLTRQAAGPTRIQSRDRLASNLSPASSSSELPSRPGNSK